MTGLHVVSQKEVAKFLFLFLYIYILKHLFYPEKGLPEVLTDSMKCFALVFFL
jgi:hypothetical protein